MKPTIARPSAQTEVDIVEVGDMSEHQTRVVLRTLARLMVRAHGGKGDHGAIVREDPADSDLTVEPHKSAHHGDEAA